MGNIAYEVETTIQDIRNRWQRAREAAYKKTFIDQKAETEYVYTLNGLGEDKFEDFLKQIFLNSRNLGLSYQKSKGLIWEKSDFTDFVDKLGVPCLIGTWEIKTTAHVLNRKGCEGGESIGSRYCQYWREAIDGLVTGISDEVGFVRNSSISVHDDKCVDVFYDQEPSPTESIWKNTNKWGALPENIKEELVSIELKFSEMKMDLKFLGLSEKKLLYKLEPKENLTCGSVGAIYRKQLEKLIKEKFPLFSLKDASPVAVYGERA
ncbi:MAG: hypothetical protein IPM57_10140 [Oligoflexia bacterium]|nr:hypothetical protein [Oligoflexia bacterium]